MIAPRVTQKMTKLCFCYPPFETPVMIGARVFRALTVCTCVASHERMARESDTETLQNPPHVSCAGHFSFILLLTRPQNHEKPPR